MATFLFEQDMADAEFLQKPASSPDFQTGTQIIDMMEPRRRALVCKLQVLHMSILEPRGKPTKANHACVITLCHS
ncbi:Hypothetical protein BROD_2284 [Brucella sp. NF 2653]|nr:Hypothetical protein BROD_2284 [Brucella sp. NF 2653]